MPNISNFPEDMLPREFPKINLRQKQNSVPLPTLPAISLIFDDGNKDCAVESPKTSVKYNKDSTKYTHDREQSIVKSAQQPGRSKLDVTLYESPSHAIENKCSFKQKPESKECKKKISCNNGHNTSNAYFSTHVDGKQKTQTRKSVGCVIENIEASQFNNTGAYRKHEDSVPVLHEETVPERRTTCIKQKPIKKHKERVNDETLVSIVEDQQQHILIQQKQIWLQQKQNLMQQNQIFALQHKIQELLLEKEHIEKNSLACKETARFILNESDNSTKNMRSTSKARTSIRAMQNFEYMTDSSSTTNPIAPQFEQDQENLRFRSSVKYMHSTGMAANLFYESSNRNAGSINDVQDIEHSFAFYKESVNYCQQSSASLDTDECCRNKMSTNINDEVSVPMSPNAYDYLFRHRLLEE